MKVPKEVISKAIMDAPETYDIPSYIAQRAAEWALQQPVSMEPHTNLWECEGTATFPKGTKELSSNCGHAPGWKVTPLYTAAQLAQARQQAEQAKDVYFAERNQARDLVYEKNKRIADLEKSNAVLLEALMQITDRFEQSGAYDHDHTVELARAAIAEVKP